MNAIGQVKVWDPVVRTGHWLLVLLFAVAYLSGESDGGLHPYAGYGVLGVVAVRFVWGFIGTRHARFMQFLRGRQATLHYLKSFVRGRPAHYLGHNPAAGWMAVLLLAMLAMTAWTGMLTYGAQGYGPLAQAAPVVSVAHANGRERGHGGERRSPAERFWKELHEFFAEATLFLVLLHIAGALVASLVHRENLVKAMITGYKAAPPG